MNYAGTRTFCGTCSKGMVTLVAVILTLPLVGCDQTRRSTGRQHTFLIVGISQDDPLWPVLQGGARAYAQNVGGLKLKMLAPATNDSAARSALVRQNLDPSVFAVCLQASADDETRKLAEDLSAHGTGVVLIGQDFPEVNRIGYVGLDEFEAGKLLAKALRSSMNERTTFMILGAGEGSDAYGARLRGFGAGMSEIAGLRELHRMDCQGDVAKAWQIFAEQGRKYPDLGMWVSIGAWPTKIDVPQLHEVLGERTKLVIIGALPPVWPLMKDGTVRAAISTDYGKWGYEAVNLAEMAFRRAQQPDRVRLTSPSIVRPEDLPAFEKTWDAWTQGQVLPTAASTRP